jgi:hypothetical protein
VSASDDFRGGSSGRTISFSANANGKGELKKGKPLVASQKPRV